ncbi:MAG: hypothetical protein GX369_08315 [Euryarchaeota archaeon]|nr:hypothetical protein [Euryarchaeota archaeon]
MKKLVFEVMKNKQGEKKEVTAPKCWICMDDGLVYYDRLEYGMKYEVAARCRCIAGQKIGGEIGLILDVMVDDIAKINFESFKKIYPETIEKAGCDQ